MVAPCTGYVKCDTIYTDYNIWKSGDWTIGPIAVHQRGVRSIFVGAVDSSASRPDGLTVESASGTWTVDSDWTVGTFADALACGATTYWRNPNAQRLRGAGGVAGWNDAPPTVTGCADPAPDPAPNCDLKLTVGTTQVCIETVPHTPTPEHMVRAMAGKHILVRGVTLQLGSALKSETLDDGKFLVCFENEGTVPACDDFDLVDGPALVKLNLLASEGFDFGWYSATSVTIDGDTGKWVVALPTWGASRIKTTRTNRVDVGYLAATEDAANAGVDENSVVALHVNGTRYAISNATKNAAVADSSVLNAWGAGWEFSGGVSAIPATADWTSASLEFATTELSSTSLRGLGGCG